MNTLNGRQAGKLLAYPSLIFCVFLAGLFSFGQSQQFDLLIQRAQVVDGSGQASYQADVAILDGRIEVISRSSIPIQRAERVIDADGLTLAPGFIDIHAHVGPIQEIPFPENFLRQGITTAVGGPDGGSPWPLKKHLEALEDQGIGLNLAYLIGHNTIRKEVLGMEDRAPTSEELDRMASMVEQAMQEGAWGLSTGLKYLPGAYAETAEIIRLAHAASRYGGIYTSHLREEGLGLLDAVREAIQIGRQSDIPVVLTHHKVIGKPMWGASQKTLAMLDEARREGLDVMLDQYPYTATYTTIAILVPPWAMAGGEEAFLERLKEEEIREKIVEGIVFNILNDRGGGDLRRIQLARVEWMREYEGKTLFDLAQDRGLKPTPETGAELVIELIERGGASAIYHVLDEQDVERIMKHPLTMIASDGTITRYGEGHPHPRWYGTFPRVLGRYAREKQVLTLEEAVQKMTSLPALRLGLTDRGRISEGYWADLVLFDPDTVRDTATFENPHQFPVGIHSVWVNGRALVDDGQFHPVPAGQVLRHRGLE